ncbi:MAG TPA: hypothetical protein VN687_18410 [Blastocatellia bacterium]|nr:hypothetical protein [Blastocatellia bacterium]
MDGTPLLEVDPSSDVWDQATRVIEQKQNAAKKEQRRLKWKRVVLTAMFTATVVMTVAAFSRSFSVTVEKPGELCIETFNDLNGNRERDEGEPVVTGFEYQVSGTYVKEETITPGENDRCKVVPVGAYKVVAQPRLGWITTTETTKTVTVNAGEARPVSFGSREAGELCIETFNDLNGNRERDEGEPVVTGFEYQVSGTYVKETITPGENDRCTVVPVGAYTVVAQPRLGWITTTETTKTVTVNAGDARPVSFGSREVGELCIETFNDLNRRSGRNEGEPALSGFSFQVSGSGINKTLTTEFERGVCEKLPVGPYTVVAIAKPGWTATTETTLTVLLTAKGYSLSFGYRDKLDECSDGDKNREWGIIINKYGSIWGETISIEHVFSQACMTALVTVTYELKVKGAVPVRKQQRYECVKTGSEWNCSAIRSRAEASVTIQGPKRTPN